MINVPGRANRLFQRDLPRDGGGLGIRAGDVYVWTEVLVSVDSALDLDRWLVELRAVLLPVRSVGSRDNLLDGPQVREGGVHLV